MVPVAPRAQPIREAGVERDARGVARYLERPRRWWRCCTRASSATRRRPPSWRSAAPTIGYGELWERAARVAGGLRAAGVARGDRVALRLGNGIDWVLAFFGAQLMARWWSR